MQINWARPHVMRPVLDLRLVITQVLLSQVVANFKNPLCFVTQQPKIPHVHRSTALPLDGIIDDADIRGIVHMDGGQWLLVAHLV